MRKSEGIYMKKEAGFTLLEMLVSVAITVVLVAATLGALTQAQHANEGVTLMANMQENLRAGMNYMVRDIVQAGEGIPTGGIPIPTNAAAPPVSNINRPAPFALTFNTAYTNLPAVIPGAAIGEPKRNPVTGAVVAGSNTDMITILYADNNLVDGAVPPNRLNGNPVFQNPGPPVCNGTITAAGDQVTVAPGCFNLAFGTNNVTVGDLILFSNGQGPQNVIQYVTAVAPPNIFFAAGGDPSGLNARVQPNNTILQMQNGAPGAGGPYPPTTITRIYMITYYLDYNTNPLRPQLMRQVNYNPPQPVGEVLEDVQFTFDVANSANPGVYPGIGPSNARDAIAPDSPNQFRKVNIYLAARSESPYSQTGQCFRNNLNTQVSLRSLAFVTKFQ
jgi:prepilin-type N-terminal cleavage/methylation domain-containing protein